MGSGSSRIARSVRTLIGIEERQSATMSIHVPSTSRGFVIAVPIGTKAGRWRRRVTEAVIKLERQLGDRMRVIRSDGGEATDWYDTIGSALRLASIHA
jgi:hypothetical protein